MRKHFTNIYFLSLLTEHKRGPSQNTTNKIKTVGKRMNSYQSEMVYLDRFQEHRMDERVKLYNTNNFKERSEEEDQL